MPPATVAPALGDRSRGEGVGAVWPFHILVNVTAPLAGTVARSRMVWGAVLAVVASM